MIKQGKHKRKLDEYKRYYKKKIVDDNKENSSDNQENENNENMEKIKEKKKKGKKNKNNKNKKKDIKNDSILFTSKESCNFIKQIMTEGEGEKIEDNNDNNNNSGDDNYNNNNEINYINNNINNEDEKKNEQKKKKNKNKKKESEKNKDEYKDEKNNDNKNNFEEKNKKIKDDKDNNYDDDVTHKNNEEANNSNNNNSNNNNSNVSEKSKSKNIDNFLLSSLYDLFEGYDEIVIKPNNENQYVIKGCLKIDEDKEIKFEINYDKERDFFDYYPNNTNFNFENEDEPFNWDLDIPKEDFTLLIKNFKKYKNK